MGRGKMPQELKAWREKHLVSLWRHQRVLEGRVVTRNGHELQVVYPGWLNRDEGPDFRGAILATKDGTLLKGDVEVHLRALDWYSHGHHRNRLYSGVILHLVLWDQGEREITLDGGTRVPIVSLAYQLEGNDPKEEGSEEALPKWMKFPKGEGLLETLDRAGEERFLTKAALYQGGMSLYSPEEILYRGVMEALGYSRNRAPFRELAERLPLVTLLGMVQGKGEADARAWLQALFLGEGGLLPSQRGLVLAPEDQLAAQDIESIWSRLNPGKTMELERWHLFRIRPGSHPVRRLAGMGQLIGRNRGLGLMRCFLDLLLMEEGSSLFQDLESVLVVDDEGYWGSHWDFGKVIRRSSLIGGDRAREIVINVVLPFFWAWAQVHEAAPLGERVTELYKRYPAAASNQITREMAGYLFPGVAKPPIHTACRQQGLIHFYKNWHGSTPRLDCAVAQS